MNNETDAQKFVRFEQALGKWEVAQFLVDAAGEDAVAVALIALEKYEHEKKAAEEMEARNPATIQGAVKIANEAGEPWRAKPIKLGVNRSKVRFNGVSAKPDAPTKTFNSIINKSTSDFNKLTQEDYLDNHRGSELPWKKRNVSASMMATVKKAALASRAQRNLGENQFAVNETAMAILKARKALQEGLTPAQQTIAIPRARTTADLLPLEFSNAKGVSVNPPSSSRSVSSMLPAEFAAAKQKAGVLKTWNDAANSLEHQPNHEKSPADDQQEYDQNTNIPHVDGMTRTALPQPNVKGRTTDYVFPDGKKNFPMKQKQPSTSTDLLSPRDVNAGNMNV